MVAGKAARVSYTPATPEPEATKAVLLPFAAQMHITIPGQAGSWQYLLIRAKPPGLNRKAHNLWPSSTQVSAYPLCSPFALSILVDSEPLQLVVMRWK